MRDDFGYHGLLRSSATNRGNPPRMTYRNRVPGTNENTVESLICPKLPDIMKAKCRLRDADAAPGSQHKNEECILEMSDCWCLLSVSKCSPRVA